MATAELQGKQALDIVPSGQLVTFTLDEVEFGLDIDRVQEITPRTDITPVPGSPSFVLGIVNLRGSIIPVLDSRLRFHLPPKPPTAKTRIIILDLAGQATGLMVDSVSEVVKLDDFTLRETPPLVAGVRSDYLAGMVTAANRLITLINLEKILDSSEFSERAQLAEKRAGLGHLHLAAPPRRWRSRWRRSCPTSPSPWAGSPSGSTSRWWRRSSRCPRSPRCPDAPPYVLGVICLRDQVLPLLDFIQLLHAEPAEQPGAGRHGHPAQLRPGQAGHRGGRHPGDHPDQGGGHPAAAPDPQRAGGGGPGGGRAPLGPHGEPAQGPGHHHRRGPGQDRRHEHQPHPRRSRAEARPATNCRWWCSAWAARPISLRLHEVREIIMVGNITPIPRAPSFIEGVLNLRGEVMPVIDLRERFGLARQAVTSVSRIVITPIGGVSTGLVVDSVEEVKSVDERRLEDPPRVTAVGANAFIEKVARVDQGVIFLLNVQCLLTEVEGQQLQAFQGKKKG